MAGSRGDSKGEAKGDSKGDLAEKLSDFVFNYLTLDDSENILKKALEERKSELVWLVRESSRSGSLAVDYVMRDKESKSIMECDSMRFVLTQRGWKNVDAKDSHSDIKITPENIEEHIGKFFSFLEKIPFEEGEHLSFSAANRVSPSIEDDCFLTQPFWIRKVERSYPSQICALSGSLIAAIQEQPPEHEELRNVIAVYDTAQRKYIKNVKCGFFHAITLNHDGSHLLAVNPWGVYEFEIKTQFLEDSKGVETKPRVQWKSLTPYDVVCDREGCIFISFTDGFVQQLKPNSSKLETIAQMESAPRLHINNNNQLVCVCMEAKRKERTVRDDRGQHIRTYTSGQPEYKYSVFEIGKEPRFLDWERAPSLTRSQFFLPNKFAAIGGVSKNVIKIVDLDSKTETQLPVNDNSTLQLTANTAGHLVTMSSEGHIKVWDASQKPDPCIAEFKVNVNARAYSNFVFNYNPFSGTLFYENHLGRFQELFLEDFNLQKEEVEKCFGSKGDMKEDDICKNMPHMHKGVIGIMLDFLRHKPSEDALVKKEVPKQQLR